jgi:hypothetical protein
MVTAITMKFKFKLFDFHGLSTKHLPVRHDDVVGERCRYRGGPHDFARHAALAIYALLMHNLLH